jgi:hypothetical protein
MPDKKIVGVAEFHSFDDDPNVGQQIDEWLQNYPEVSLIDVKYEVVSYVENDVVKFATFALALFHEPETSPEINRASTQRMQLPTHIRGKR